MTQSITITGPSTDFAVHGEAILRSLPEWFGMEDSLLDYVKSLDSMPTFAAHVDGVPVGFLALHRHFPRSAEVHIMGIVREHHRQGIGRRLIQAAESWLRSEGVRVLQVKTVGPSKDDASYARTRQFYEGVGFEPLEEFPTLWDEWNPCLVLVKTIG